MATRYIPQVPITMRGTRGGSIMPSMPLVLTTAEGKHQAGYQYDDRTGISYEYPSGRYENWIIPGERFVYHQPRRGYTGTGVIGPISSSKQAGRLVCEVLDYHPFDDTVPLRNSNGDQYEADPATWSKGNVYWAQGVRPIAEDRFESILLAAGQIAPYEGVDKVASHAKYALGGKWVAVDAYAMKIALELMIEHYPGREVVRMPHNNPGFDIRVGPSKSPDRYVEVKGTQAATPVFFLSEGERTFSAQNAEKYTMLVVAGINIVTQTHGTVTLRHGEVTAAGADLEPVQWRGRLVTAD